jgi:hypothetical protein
MKQTLSLALRAVLAVVLMIGFYGVMCGKSIGAFQAASRS